MMNPQTATSLVRSNRTSVSDCNFHPVFLISWELYLSGTVFFRRESRIQNLKYWECHLLPTIHTNISFIKADKKN